MRFGAECYWDYITLLMCGREGHAVSMILSAPKFTGDECWWNYIATRSGFESRWLSQKESQSSLVEQCFIDLVVARLKTIGRYFNGGPPRPP